MDYHFLIHPRAKQELEAAPADVRSRIRTKIKKMVTNEFRELTDYDVTKLRGTDNDIYRTRIGDWRVLFAMNTEEETTYVGIVSADKRSGAYGNIDTVDDRADEF